MAQSFPRIYSSFRLATVNGTETKKFFEVFDNLDHAQQGDLKPKIMLQIAEHSSGKSTVVHHSLDIDTARYLARLIVTNKLGTVDEAKHFEEFKGGPNPKSGKGVTSPTGYVSRQLQLVRESATTKRPNVGNKGKYSIYITNGPGQRGDKGQVTPVTGHGDPVKCFFNLTDQEAMTMALKLEAWLDQWMQQNFAAVRAAHTDVYEPVAS